MIQNFTAKYVKLEKGYMGQIPIEMKKNLFLHTDELVEKAVGILLETLGPVDTNRFLALSPKRRLDLARPHQKWQKSLEKNTFFSEVFGKAGFKKAVRA